MPIKMKECFLINLSSHFSHLFQRGISSGIVWKLVGDPFYISQVRFLLSFVLKIQSPWISNLISFLSVLAWCTKKKCLAWLQTDSDSELFKMKIDGILTFLTTVPIGHTIIVGQMSKWMACTIALDDAGFHNMSSFYLFLLTGGD